MSFQKYLLGSVAVVTLSCAAVALPVLASSPHAEPAAATTSAPATAPAANTAHPHKKKTQKRKTTRVKKSAKAAVDKNKTGETEDAKSEKWDVTNPPLPTREIPIKTSEGTWMSLDVSPDGKTIAFDLLGDIYTMPIRGGKATAIASGMAWEIQPRFSPDGTRIAFTSDRAGGDNIWTMAIDGSDMQQVSNESFRLLNNPTWSPDGRFIAARKHFTTSRSLGTGEIWLYHTSGGSGVQLTKKPSEAHQKEIGEPKFSPDGKHVYFSANTTSGPIFEYAQDSNTQLFQIKRYHMETGEVDNFVSGAGGAVRPEPSPDGKYIAFVRRDRAKSKLYVKDIKSGAVRKVFDLADQDMQETWAVHGVYPNMDWMPDSQTIVFWSGGKINALNVETGKSKVIPFKVSDTRDVVDPPRPAVDVSPDEVKTRMPRFVQSSPDGSHIVFESLGKLWLKHPGGKTARLTSLTDELFEVYPSFSADGNTVIFTTWNDETLGAIHKIDIHSGAITTLSEDPGHYQRPALSPSGRYVVYQKASGGYMTAPEWSAEPGLYVMDTETGEQTRFSQSGSYPHFAGSDDRIYFTANRGGNSALVSVDRGGDKERVHANSKLAQSFFMAPTQDTIAFRENYNLYVMPATGGAQNVAAGTSGTSLPVKKVSHGGSTYPSFSADGKTLSWSIGPTLMKASIDDVMTDKDYKAPSKGEDVSITVQADRPEGMIALTGARIITMADEDGGIIENGVIITDGHRIKAVGSADDVTIPRGAEVVKLDGKTIMPGLIDAHAHGPHGVSEMIPQQNWNAMAHLALGVTTTFNPSSRASEIFAAAEMQRAGKIIGPRTFSTGEIIYGAKAPGFFAAINNEDDAQEHVSRLKSQGAHAVKNYNQPRRDQRQQVVKAAIDLDVATVAEGGSLYHMDLSMVADGNTSIEHNLPQSELYDDVIQFYGQTEVAYTPTLSVTYGGIRGEDYYYQIDDVWRHPILKNHVPPRLLQARSVRRQMAPIEDYADDDSAATSKKLMEAGVLVSIGAHGQREGLAAHWEMWTFVRGGMSPLQALKTATVNPAKHLGYIDDIGTLEDGKLADLIIMDKNPLDKIRNTESLTHVMIGGRLYEAGTMNEVVSGDRERKPYFWE